MHLTSRSTLVSALGLLILVAVFGLFGSAWAELEREVTPEEEAWLEDVRAEIVRNGYHWTAGPTSVSHLSPEERAGLLGGRMSASETAYFDTLSPDPAVLNMRFRDAFDWRDYDGVTPADNQLDCGSCWAFGACGATEAHVRIYEGVILDLSEQQSIDCNFQGSDCDGGSSAHAFELHVDPGGVLEECYPYDAENGASCRQNRCEKVAIIDGQATISYNVSSLKYACQTYGPLAVGMCVYDDFYGYTGGCYEHGGTDPVNHVVLLCGWDDSMCGGAGAWLVKNSWGQDFGDNGFFWIKYNSCWIGLGARRPVNAHVPKIRLVPDEYASIQNAIDNSERGDVIKVAGGTYSGSLTVSDYVSLYGGYDPTFSTRDPETYQTVIDGGGSGNVVTCQNIDHIVIDGFEIRNSGATSYGISIKNTEVTVSGCEVYDCWRGIGVEYGSGGATEGDAIVEYCEVRDNTNIGIFINDPDNPSVKLRYVAVHDNGAEGIYTGASQTEIRNCTVALNGMDGGIEINGGTGIVINNCVVASNTGYGIVCASATPQITYSDVWDNSLGGYSGCSAGTGCASWDPIFCDAPSGDVSVHATSPTLGAGESGTNMGALGIGCPIGPQNLAIAQNGASLDLTWDEPPARVDVDYYVVYRDTAQIPLTPLTTVDAGTTAFTDITIPPCEEHNYWVSAVYTDSLEGASSNRVIGELCYDGPTGLSATFSEGANELSWSHGSGPIDYYVIRRGNDLVAPDSLDWVPAAEASYVDMTGGGCPRDNYSYEILPVYDTGWRGVVSGHASLDPAPSPPSGITAEWVASDIELNWDPNCESDFGRYWVYRDTIPFSPPVDSELLVGFTPDTTFLDESPNPSWTYFYRLAATDGSSQRSTYSDMVVVGTGTTLTVPSPYGTIQAAINAASAIDTVLVSPGTYPENITLKNGVIVVSTDGRATTTITSSSGTVVTSVGSCDLTLLKGFTIDGQGTAQMGLDCWTSYLRVEDCAITNCSTGANFKYGGSATVSESRVTANAYGVSVADSAAPFLSSNTIDVNSFAGIYVTGDPGPRVGQTLGDANDIMDNAFFEVFNVGTATVDADYNYWGNTCVGDSLFYGLVDYVPWTDETHTETYTECGSGVWDGVSHRATLSHNFPNPFNPSTAIRYTVPSPGGEVSLAVYDLSGRKVRTLVDSTMGPGDYVAMWHGRDDSGRELGSGVYFYRLEMGSTRLERKMVLLK